MRRFLVFLACTGLLAGCTEKSPGAPSTFQPGVTGTWAGDLMVDGVTGRMTWTLVQTDSTVGGPVLVSLPNGTVLMNGFLTGTLTGTTLQYLINVQPGGIPTRPECGGQLAGTMTVAVGLPSTLSGPMAITSSTCVLPLTGPSLTLVKQ